MNKFILETSWKDKKMNLKQILEHKILQGPVLSIPGGMVQHVVQVIFTFESWDEIVQDNC